ncbi:MAG: NfeD family protein [Hyphomonadaceae bacterium]
MGSVTELLTHLTLWHWVGLGIILLSLEVAVGTFDLLWVAVGAFVTALFALIIPAPAGAWQGQLVFFGVSAVAFVILGRTVFRGLRHRASTHPNLNDRMTTMVGQRGEARSPFQHGKGRVRIGDTEWQASQSDDSDIALGDEVVVTGAEGSTLTVRRAQASAA